MYLILSNFCPLKIFSIYCVLPLEPIIFLFIFIAYCEKHFGSYLDKHLLHHHILYKIILLLHVSLRRGNNVSLISESYDNYRNIIVHLAKMLEVIRVT